MDDGAVLTLPPYSLVRFPSIPSLSPTLCSHAHLSTQSHTGAPLLRSLHLYTWLVLSPWIMLCLLWFDLSLEICFALVCKAFARVTLE